MILPEPNFWTSLIAGGVAGTAVDVILFPLDTLKTRLQSSLGFYPAGGFRGIYAGLLSATLGSAPTAACFFATYETTKKLSRLFLPESMIPVSHMFAASCGETVACLIRVPIEVVKQRTQASPHLTSLSILKKTINQEGFRGLYRGYFSTLMREIPFSLIQFPIWEYAKVVWSERQGKYVDSWQSALCGAFAGSIAAAVTTPLDVAKTRIILADKGTEVAKGYILQVLNVIWLEKGISGLFAGIVPRVMWISVGGCIFFGVYEKAKAILTAKEKPS